MINIGGVNGLDVRTYLNMKGFKTSRLKSSLVESDLHRFLRCATKHFEREGAMEALKALEGFAGFDSSKT